MSEHGGATIEPSEGTRRTRRASRTWLLIAVASTAVAAVFLGYSLFQVYSGLEPGASSSASVAEAPDAEPLVLAIGRTPGGQAEWSNYVVLLRFMQDRLGRPIRVRYIADREAVSSIFEDGEVDGGFLCTRSYLVLEQEGLVRAIAVPVTNGASTENAMIFVRADSGLTSFEDLKGRSIAISSKTSVSGAAYLYWLAEQKGVSVQEYFDVIDVSPTQEEGLRKLAKGTVDAAVGCSTEARSFPAGTFRAVATSPEYAMPPFVVSTSLDQATADAMLEALLDFDARSELPSDSVLGGFQRVSDSDYHFSRVLLEYVPVGSAQ